MANVPRTPRRMAVFVVNPLLTDENDFVVSDTDGIVQLNLMDRLAVRSDDPAVFDRIANAATEAASTLRRRRRRP